MRASTGRELSEYQPHRFLKHDGSMSTGRVARLSATTILNQDASMRRAPPRNESTIRKPSPPSSRCAHACDASARVIGQGRGPHAGLNAANGTSAHVVVGEDFLCGGPGFAHDIAVGVIDDLEARATGRGRRPPSARPIILVGVGRAIGEPDPGDAPGGVALIAGFVPLRIDGRHDPPHPIHTPHDLAPVRTR